MATIGANSPIEEFDGNYEFNRSIADLYGYGHCLNRGKRIATWRFDRG